MRPIDADFLVKGIEENFCNVCIYNGIRCLACDIRTCLDYIEDTPTIDAEPVRHGRWIRGASKGWPTNPSCLWYCSCCGEKIRYVDTLRTYQKIKKPVNEVNPYCRKCGAKMDRGDCNENS